MEHGLDPFVTPDVAVQRPTGGRRKRGHDVRLRQLMMAAVCLCLLGGCAALQQPATAESTPAGTGASPASGAGASARTIVVVFSDGSKRSFEGATNVAVTTGGALTFNHREGTEFFAAGWWREARQLP